MSTTIPTSVGTTIGVDAFDLSEHRFTTHLLNNARRFFPDLDPQTTTVRRVRHEKRVRSQLLEIEVRDNSSAQKVIYKAPFVSPNSEPIDADAKARPRLFPTVDPVGNGIYEYRALRSLERHFSSLQDDRFGVISVCELLERPFVVVMKKCPDPCLKSLLKKSTRFHATVSRSSLYRAFRNAGAWLREFHTLPDLAHTQQRHPDRDCFVEAIHRITGGLIGKIGRRSFLQDVRRCVIGSALKNLPAELPRAVVHGDFAPRNLLVGADSRVTVFDTLRRWRAPVYEDLAYMLMSVKAARPQVRSHGSLFSEAQLAKWESEFLSGYFGEGCVPLATVRLYECLLTLEWWAAINFRQHNGSLFERTGLTLSNHYLIRYIRKLLLDL